MFAPDAEQRRAVIDLGGLPQPRAGGRAAAALQAPQEFRMRVRRVPQLPGGDAGCVPNGVLVGAAIPQVNVPAQAIDGLAADAAVTGAAAVRLFAKWRGRRAERHWQLGVIVVLQPPGPAPGRARLRGERPGQTIGPQRVGVLVAVVCLLWFWR